MQIVVGSDLKPFVTTQLVSALKWIPLCTPFNKLLSEALMAGKSNDLKGHKWAFLITVLPIKSNEMS